MPSKNKNILYICTRLWFENILYIIQRRAPFKEYFGFQKYWRIKYFEIFGFSQKCSFNYTMFEVYKKEG